MFSTKYSALFMVFALLVGVSSCGDKVETRPWQDSFGTAVEFGFEDTDPDKGELQGGVVLRGVTSPTGYDKFEVYWSPSNNEEEKSGLLGQRSFADFKTNPLLTLPENTPSSGAYLLLFISSKDQSQYTGKFVKIRDLVKAADSSADQALGGPQTSIAKTYDPNSAKVMFEFDQSSLSSEYRNQLEQIFIEYPVLSNEPLVIVGHGDARGSNAYNLALGQRRAQAVKKYLVRVIGVDADNIKAYSCGEEQPLASGQSAGAWTKNRRAVTLQVEGQAYDCASKAEF